MTDQFVSPSLKSRLAACLVAAGFLLAPPAFAQSRQQQQAVQSVADQQQDRIEELQRQLTDATAENENLQHQLMDAQREITRLHAMVGNLAQVNQDAVAAIQNPNAAPPVPPSDANGSATSQPNGLDGAADSQIKPTSPSTQGQLGTLSRSDLPPALVPTPADAYANARALLVNGQYAEAENAFGDFLQRYPNAETAADAQFWLAFTQLARNNYQDAAANFVRYLQAAPNSPRAPEAQVRLGMALAGMGQTRQACGAYANLPRRYPNAARNIRDLAAREARASACPAN